MYRFVLGLLFTAPFAFPIGPFAIGLKGGVPITSNFTTGSTPQAQFTADTKRYTFGPTLEFRGPLGLGAEIDALYRRLDFESQAMGVDVFVRQATTANTWDIPLLFKWRFGPGSVKPYVSVGPTFRYVSSVEQIESFFSVPLQRTTETKIDNPSELDNRFTAGFTISGGLQLGSHIAPEIRYIRWGWKTFSAPSGAFRSNDNEVLFLLGLTF